MVGETGRSLRARQFSRQGFSSKSRRLWRRVCLAIAGVGLLVAAPYSTSAEAQTACTSQGSADQAEIMDAACCPSDVLTPYWPERSPQLNKTFCQLLVFPTATLPNSDNFTQRIVDGSLSSNSRRASAETMTLPSLWWNRDSLTSHLGGRRLVNSWLSYRIKDSGTGVIDVIINPQIWSVLTYNERFAVLNQFGTAARDFGYNLRFFEGNSRNYRIAGLYACDFADQPGEFVASEDSVQTCTANLDSGLIVLLQRNLLAEGERRQASAQAAKTEDSLADLGAAVVETGFN